MENWVSYEDIYEAYLDCRKRKRNTASCAEFEMNEAENLIKLYNDLNNKTYTIGRSIAFCVTRPKVREVFAANFRDRIVHHFIFRKINELFEQYFINDTYSCRKNKGTTYAHKRALAFSKRYKGGWVLCCDIKGFFMSIPKSLLFKNIKEFLLSHYIEKDLDNLLWLIEMVVMHHPEMNCKLQGYLSIWDKIPKEKSLFTCDNNLGMAIGNLTSQLFANFYMTEFDRWLTDIPEISYCRYVDDFRIFSNDKVIILQLIPKIKAFLKEKLNLTLHPRKISLQPTIRGFNFV